ncbi:hypothetical protein J3E68DRAFT_411276 [Trichoderma sp. SZMC 28012]
MEVSMFERLVKLSFPVKTHQVQRRMISQICKIVQTFSPMLQDHAFLLLRQRNLQSILPKFLGSSQVDLYKTAAGCLTGFAAVLFVQGVTVYAKFFCKFSVFCYSPGWLIGILYVSCTNFSCCNTSLSGVRDMTLLRTWQLVERGKILNKRDEEKACY